MRRPVVASAILATLLSLPLVLAAPPASAAPPTDPERATAALEYLLAAQRADGSIDGSLGETADFVFGTAAAGYDPDTLHGCTGGTGALEFLATASDGAAADAAATGKAVLAVVAAGGDPSRFAGRNLLARLTALYHSAGGAYGDGATFSQSFAILAFVASGQAVPADAVTELKALQDSDGSWSFGTAPVAAGQGDTNSTAIALMALDAAGANSADAKALAYLHTQQLTDGGFPYQNSSTFGPPSSDPDSDSIVLQALVAAAQDPEAVAWSQGPNTVLTHLRAAQGADGGYAYPGMAENPFTTSQVPAALVRTPYAAAVHWTVGRGLPMDACPTATPTASASAGPSQIATPSATPTATPSPKPTARPTARPIARATPKPSAAAPAAQTANLPTPSSTATAAPPAVLTSSPTPTSAVAGATVPGGPPSRSGADAGSTGGLPAPVLYGLAALAALLAVAGGGWALILRQGRR
jgi:hypothetical protein